MRTHLLNLLHDIPVKIIQGLVQMSFQPVDLLLAPGIFDVQVHFIRSLGIDDGLQEIKIEFVIERIVTGPLQIDIGFIRNHDGTEMKILVRKEIVHHIQIIVYLGRGNGVPLQFASGLQSVFHLELTQLLEDVGSLFGGAPNGSKRHLFDVVMLKVTGFVAVYRVIHIR